MAYKFQILGAQVRAKGEHAQEARDRIVRALAKHDGDTAAAAVELGVARRSLYTWMRMLGIATPMRTREAPPPKSPPKKKRPAPHSK